MTSFLTLNSRGILLAFVVGILIFLLGKNDNILFIADILLFLVLSAIVTKMGRHKKQGLGVYENERGWKNVLSNGLVPLAVAFVYFVNYTVGFLPQTTIAEIYIASLAAVTADKFASEIGVLDGEPTMLLTFQKVKKGMSGGITLLGTLASLIGALLIGSTGFLVGGGLLVVAFITVSGFLGGMVDSIFGYFEEKGIGDKYTSNFVCAVAGCVICAILIIW